LSIGQIDILSEPPAQSLPEQYQPLANILEGVIDDLGKLYEGLDRHYNDADWVSYRFAEILPIPPEHKQSCLETDDPIQRIESMRAVLESIRL